MLLQFWVWQSKYISCIYHQNPSLYLFYISKILTAKILVMLINQYDNIWCVRQYINYCYRCTPHHNLKNIHCDVLAVRLCKMVNYLCR